MAEPLEMFAAEARSYCDWIASTNGPGVDVASALRRVVAVVAVYVAALSLPTPFSDGLSAALVDVELPADSVERMRARVETLPIEAYWEIFDPIENPPDEPVVGSISDDLGDIYRDIVRGLLLFDSGQRDEALWEWAFNFRIHWGNHAASAIRALHAYLAQENPDGLSSDA